MIYQRRHSKLGGHDNGKGGHQTQAGGTVADGTYNDHCKILEEIRNKLGISERPPDGNGGYLERRKKKPIRQQWRELPLYKKISTIIIAVPFIGSYWNWILDQLHKFLDLLETIPK